MAINNQPHPDFYPLEQYLQDAANLLQDFRRTRFSPRDQENVQRFLQNHRGVLGARNHRFRTEIVQVAEMLIDAIRREIGLDEPLTAEAAQTNLTTMVDIQEGVFRFYGVPFR